MNIKKRIKNFFATSRTNKIIALVAVVAVGIVGYGLIAVKAGYFAAVDPSQSAVSGNAQLVSDTTSLTGKALQFVAPVAPPPPSQTGCKALPSKCGYPDATNTGVPTGHTLVKQPQNSTDIDYTITAPGYYSNIHVTGSLNIQADNVTVQYAKIDCVGVGSPNGHDTCVVLGASNDKLMDAEVGGGADGKTFGNVGSAVYSGGDATTKNQVIRANVHHGDDGFRIDGGTTIQDTYVHDLSDGINGSHSDGSQSCGGTDMNFLHNTIIGYNNDPIFLQGGDCGSNVASTLDRVVVDNNLLLNSVDSGYGISIGLAKNVVVSHNRFDRGWQVTPVGVYISNTLVLALPINSASGTLVTDTTWASLGNIFDDNGSAVSFPGN